MAIWIAVLLLAGVLIGLHFFSTWYIQFLYKKLYLDNKSAIDDIVNSSIVPRSWKKCSKQKCIQRVEKLTRFVKQDKFYSDDEKALIFETLRQTKLDWTGCSDGYFSNN